MRLREAIFLFAVYVVGLYLRLAPRLEIDPHLLTFQGDIWYRLCMAQFIYDNKILPHPDIRYLAYGYVPMWYPPLSPILFAAASYLLGVDIPTVSSRVVPFIEALTPLSLYFLAKTLYNEKVAYLSTLVLAFIPSFVFWSGISDPQSFTLFLIPVYILLWVNYANRGYPPKRDFYKLVVLGILLALNFLMHLSYFVALLVLLMVTISLIATRIASRSLLLDFGIVVFISQISTALWWALMDSKTLYWWWIKALVTSSGLYPMTTQLKEFGVIAALFGICGFIYIVYQYLFSHRLRHLILILWALPLIIETQNEVIISLLAKLDPSFYSLEWSTLGKPLEGFRFYPFLAQPIAIAIGVMLADIEGKLSMIRRKSGYIFIGLAMSLLLFGVYQYNLDVRFQTSGLIIEEYKAARWFKENSNPQDRIIADYYRAQMFAGVCGGRALLGGMFPLRNVDYPYIKAPGEVQNHLYILYKTPDARTAWEIAKRYGATHIFYSDNMIRYGNLLSYYKPASEYGVEVDKDKFKDRRYFDIVYRKNSPYGEVVIVRVK